MGCDGRAVIGNVVFTQSIQISRLAFHESSIGAGDDSSMNLATRSVNIAVIAIIYPTSTPPPPPTPCSSPSSYFSSFSSLPCVSWSYCNDDVCVRSSRFFVDSTSMTIRHQLSPQKLSQNKLPKLFAFAHPISLLLLPSTNSFSAASSASPAPCSGASTSSSRGSRNTCRARCTQLLHCNVREETKGHS